MKSTVFGCLFIVCGLLAPGLSVSAHAFSIAFPPPQSYVETEAVNIVLKLGDESLDSIVATVNTFSYPARKVTPGAEYLCFGITLATGKNVIVLDGYTKKKKVVSRELEIFFRSPLKNSSKRKSRRFKRYVFHTENNEKACGSCHNMDPGLADLNPARPEDSPCYSCHNNKLTRANLHVPSQKWECLQCHELKKDGPKYSVPKPVEILCYRCHGKKVSGWKKMKMVHGPTGLGQCTLCHDPHGSDFPALARMQVTDLCTNCHTEKESGQHVIAGFFGKGHPTRGVPDPFVPGKEFTCAGCHSRHASNFANLLRRDGSNMGPYCNGCHKK